MLRPLFGCCSQRCCILSRNRLSSGFHSQDKPYTDPKTGITCYGRGIVTASLDETVVAPYAALCHVRNTSLSMDERVAYLINEEGKDVWVTGIVAGGIDCDKVELNPQGIYFDSYDTTIKVERPYCSLVPTVNFLLWSSKRFLYFGNPQGRMKATDVLWMERSVDMLGVCASVQTLDLIGIGGVFWMVLGFYRSSSSEIKIAFLKDPHNMDTQEEFEHLLRRVCATASAGILTRLERVPRTSTASLKIFEECPNGVKKIMRQIYDRIVIDVHSLSTSGRLQNYGELSKSKSVAIHVANSVPLSALIRSEEESKKVSTATALDPVRPSTSSSPKPSSSSTAKSPYSSKKPSSTPTTTQASSTNMTMASPKTKRRISITTKKRKAEDRSYKAKSTPGKKSKSVVAVAEISSDDDDMDVDTGNKSRAPKHTRDSTMGIDAHQLLLSFAEREQSLMASSLAESKQLVNELRDRVDDLKKEKSILLASVEDRERNIAELNREKGHLEVTVAQKRSELSQSQEDLKLMSAKWIESEEKRKQVEQELEGTQSLLGDVRGQLQNVMDIRFDKEKVQEALRCVFRDEMKSFLHEMTTLVTSQSHQAPPLFNQVRPIVQSK